MQQTDLSPHRAVRLVLWGKDDRSVLPAFQGRGIASTATAQAVASARSGWKLRFLHAFPSVDNPPSNAICRKLGFTLLEECVVEYPPGSFMRCNDWQFDLFSEKLG